MSRALTYLFMYLVSLLPDSTAPPTVRIVHSGLACNIEEERYSERVYTIREGETLELTCLVTGHPRPQVSPELWHWRKHSQTFLGSQKVYILEYLAKTVCVGVCVCNSSASICAMQDKSVDFRTFKLELFLCIRWKKKFLFWYYGKCRRHF